MLGVGEMADVIRESVANVKRAVQLLHLVENAEYGRENTDGKDRI